MKTTQCSKCPSKASGTIMTGQPMCFICAADLADKIEVLVHDLYGRKNPYSDAWRIVWGEGTWPSVPPAMISDEPDLSRRVCVDLISKALAGWRP